MNNTITRWMSRADLADHLDVSPKTVSRWIKAGMPHCRTGPTGGQYRFDVDAVDAWFKERHGRGEVA